MSELTDNLNDYKFTWSTPWELSEEQQRVLCLKLAQVVAEAMPWIGAASLKLPTAPESSLPPVHRSLATIDELRAALAQHSDANDVSNSDVQLLQLSVESLTRLVGARPAAMPDPYHQSRYADLLDGISVALADLRAAANRMPTVDQGLVAAIYNLERAMETHGGQR